MPVRSNPPMRTMISTKPSPVERVPAMSSASSLSRPKPPYSTLPVAPVSSPASASHVQRPVPSVVKR